jgi:hypothetical protein
VRHHLVAAIAARGHDRLRLCHGDQLNHTLRPRFWRILVQPLVLHQIGGGDAVGLQRLDQRPRPVADDDRLEGALLPVRQLAAKGEHLQ